MTVASDLKTAVASLKNVQACFETFALSTENQQAKTLFTNAAEQTQNVLDQVSPRVQQIESEEPQYKGF
jgi:cell fate (sporulation/competence/biofilm development) regulator YlbF (YheA/YmcA/DUF963 family)